MHMVQSGKGSNFEIESAISTLGRCSLYTYEVTETHAQDAMLFKINSQIFNTIAKNEGILTVI